MRIQPVEKPKGVILKLAYRSCARQLGKAITPLTVVYAHVPAFLRVGYGISKFIQGACTLDPTRNPDKLTRIPAPDEFN